MASENYSIIFLTHFVSFIVLSAASARVLMSFNSLLMGENSVWQEVKAGNQRVWATATGAQSQFRAHVSLPPGSAGRSCYHLLSRCHVTITITICGSMFPLRPLISLFPSHPTAPASSSAPTVYQADFKLLRGPQGHQDELSTAFVISPGTADLPTFGKVCSFNTFSFLTWTSSPTSPFITPYQPDLQPTRAPPPGRPPPSQ